VAAPLHGGGNMLDKVHTDVDLEIFSAHVNATVASRMKAELNRCIKKDPPSNFKYDLIYVGTFLEAYSLQIKYGN
jgi:hypothetical protein